MSQQDMDLLLWLHAEAAWLAAHRLEVGDRLAWRLVEAEQRLASVEASRRDWAAEAARLDEENERVKAGNADMLERLIQAERSLAELQEYVSAYHKVLVANHPNGRDLALLAVAQAREATDSGTRYSLEDVEREFAVHPEADREDAALLAIAEARAAADTGERHSLDDVARQFGVDLGEVDRG